MGEKRSHLSVYWKIVIVTAVLTVVLNAAAFSTAFCDLYSRSIYAVISDVGGRLTDIFPFALGEIIMYISVLAVLAAVVLVVLLIFLRKKESFKAVVNSYMKILLMYVCIMLLIYTFNWVIPYRSSLLGKSFEVGIPCDEEHLRKLREYLIEKTNEESELVKRDANGGVIYPDDSVVRDEIAASMRQLSAEYDRLSGYYPRAKKALCSELLDYMWIGGYTYPYTMEITVNRYTDRQYYPTLFAHESAHHQGYYKENETNFISFLACINSEDHVLRYSGYLFAYFYVEEAYIGVLPEADEELYKRFESIRLLDRVHEDRLQSLVAASLEFENSAGALSFLESVAEDTAELGWDAQSEMIGENGYDGVVPLLLEWYEGL